MNTLKMSPLMVQKPGWYLLPDLTSLLSAPLMDSVPRMSPWNHRRMLHRSLPCNLKREYFEMELRSASVSARMKPDNLAVSPKARTESDPMPWILRLEQLLLPS